MTRPKNKPPRNEKDWTSMPIRKTTLRRLAKHGIKGDTYDDIIRNLLKEAKK